MPPPASTPSVALCGAGMISMAHAAAAAFAGFPVVAVASRTPERARERAAAAGARAVPYSELPAGADIVVISTPPQRHAFDTVAMLTAGAAVVLEKPLCRTLEEADVIVEAAEAHGNRLLYAENMAYAPIVEAVLARVSRIGPLTHLEARALSGVPTWGDFTTNEWGGGALFDLGVHPLAIVMLTAAAADAGSVRSVACTLRGGEAHVTDEHAEVTLHHSGGLVSNVVSSWAAGPQPVWDVQAASAGAVVRAEIMPTPMLEHDGEVIDLPPITATMPSIEQFGYLGQLRAFADDLAHHNRPFMDAHFGRAVLEVVCAAYASAGKGGEDVTLPFRGPRDRTPLQLWRG